MDLFLWGKSALWVEVRVPARDELVVATGEVQQQVLLSFIS